MWLLREIKASRLYLFVTLLVCACFFASFGTLEEPRFFFEGTRSFVVFELT
jgi:hypothetical protein